MPVEPVCAACPAVCVAFVSVYLSWISVPGVLGHADLRDRRVPTPRPVSPRLHGGARVERCHGLARERASVHRASCKTYTTA